MLHSNLTDLRLLLPYPKYQTMPPRFVHKDAVDVFKLRNCHRNELTLDGNVAIQKKSSFEGPEEPEPKSVEGAVTVLRLNGTLD